MAVTIPRFLAPEPTAPGAPSHSPPDTVYVPGDSTVRYLGYFSLGLGLAELLAPDLVADISGVRQERVLQAYGVREIASGIGILASRRPTGWVWARVAGDALDIATALVNLGEASGERRTRLFGTLVALAGVTALDALCAGRLTAADALTNDKP